LQAQPSQNAPWAVVRVTCTPLRWLHLLGTIGPMRGSWEGPLSGVNAWFRSVWGSPERYDSLLFRAYLVFLVFAIIFPWLAYAMPVGAARASIGPANLLLAGLLGTVGVRLLRGRLPALPRLRVTACVLAAVVLVLSLAGLPKAEPVVTLQLLVTGSAGVAALGAGLIQNLFYLGLYEKLFLLLVGLVVAAVPIHEASQLPMLTTWRQTKRETRAVRRRRMRARRRPTPRHAVAVAGGRGVR
jgi:hypothetical protein